MRFREVICPYCNHRYMDRMDEGGIKAYDCYHKETGIKLDLSLCPKCSCFNYALKDVLEGFKEDDPRIEKRSIN